LAPPLVSSEAPAALTNLDFGVFKRIKSFSQFQRVRIAFDTVAWECGADLDPEFVHAKSRIVKNA
jgi:hypothetical protein